MAKESKNNKSNKDKFSTDNIEDVIKVQEKLKETSGYIRPHIPEGTKLTEVVFTRDMALALILYI